MPLSVDVYSRLGGTTGKSLSDPGGGNIDVAPLCDERGLCYLDGHLATKAMPSEWQEVETPAATGGIPTYDFSPEIPEEVLQGPKLYSMFRPKTLNGPWMSAPIIKDLSTGRFFAVRPHVLPRDRLDAPSRQGAIVTERIARHDVRIRLGDSFLLNRGLVSEPELAESSSVLVRIDLASHAPAIVRRSASEALGDLLRDMQMGANPGGTVRIHSNRKVPGVVNFEDASLAQLKGMTLEVTHPEEPSPIEFNPRTTLIDETVGTPHQKALHTTDENDRRGKALNETERRQIMHMLDLAEYHRATATKNRTTVPADQKLSYRKIAELTGKHHNTIAKLKKQRDTQECRREEDKRTGIVRTLDAPVAGKQGGFRWCRLNDEQKQLCTRIAIEDPKLTTTQIRSRIQDAYPELTTLSDSTVWRVLHDSNLQYLRAKMKDPRSEGTQAHKDELAMFLREQQKGEDGQLGALNLFFMDETLVSLNETMTHAWGTATKPGIIKQSKGKTVTIGLHAGIGLVSKTLGPEDWKNAHAGFDGSSVDKYAPRGNHMVLRGGKWEIAPEAPKFMLFWMLRPPGRKEDALSRFLGGDDILDSNFTLFVPCFAMVSEPNTNAVVLQKSDVTKDHEPNAAVLDRLCERHGAVRAYTIQDAPGRHYVFQEDSAVKLIKDGAFVLEEVERFCEFEFDAYASVELMAKILWLNNVEWRQVDEDGEIVNVSSVNKTKAHKVWCTLERMREHMKALQALVARTVIEHHRPSNAIVDKLRAFDVAMDDVRVPRAYHGKLARQNLGGVIESKRGDRSNFLRYLVKHNDYVMQSFPQAEVHDNMVEVWDSAADHGAVNVTKQVKSFMHDWVQRYLKIKGCVFLPARLPDFNPSELLFSFIKGVIKRRFPSHTGEVTVDEMIRLIDEAFQEVTEEMIKGWLRYGCYRIPNDPKRAVVERNDRCGYNHLPRVEIWEELIAEWERRNFKIDSAIRADFVAADFTTDALDQFKKARIAFCGRYRRAYDIFGKTKDPIKKILIGPTHSRTVIEFGKDPERLDTDIQLESPIEIQYQSSQIEPVFHPDNYKSDVLASFDRDVLQLREDKSGFRVLHAYTHMKELLSTRTQTAVDRLNDLCQCNVGLLHRLHSAYEAGLAVASIISPHLIRSDAIAVEDMLLDVQERTFHAKLDGKRPKVKLVRGNDQRSIFERLDVSAHTRRTLPIRTCLRSPDSTKAHDGDVFTVHTIESLVVGLVKDNGDKSQFGNRRIVDAVFECHEDENEKLQKRADLDRAMRAIETELSDTPYSASIPDATTPARPFAVATIAIKAYRHERRRMTELLTECMRRYHLATDDAARAVIFEDCIRRWERRTAVGTLGVTAQGERTTEGGVDVLNSASQAPLFVISKLRSERRSAVQLTMLARSDDGDRRYPGYPLEQSEQRDGKPFKTHAPGDSHAPPEPVQSVDIQLIVRRSKGSKDAAEEVVIGRVVLQNGEIHQLGARVDPVPTRNEKDLVEVTRATHAGLASDHWGYASTSNDRYYIRVYQGLYDDQYRKFFGSYARENVVILHLAKKRYYENITKSTNVTPRKSDADVVVGVIDKIPLRYDYKGAEIQYTGASRHTLFDPDRSLLHPSVFGTVRYFRSKDANSSDPLVVGIVDRDVLTRRKMSPAWMVVTTDSDLGKILKGVCTPPDCGTLKFGAYFKVHPNAKNDKKLLLAHTPAANIQLIYHIDNGGPATDLPEQGLPSEFYVIPAWRKGKLPQKIRDGAVRHLIKAHSLSISMPSSHFYNLTPTLYWLNLGDGDIGPMLLAVFGHPVALPREVKLEDHRELRVTLHARNSATVIVYNRNSIVIRRDSIKKLIETNSLLQLQMWCKSDQRELLEKTKQYFNFDAATYDILDDDNLLRLL
tara:strand:+ start:1390 stop:7029 length:5640 start_codon:yes stop_codon:yes gene_type:complete